MESNVKHYYVLFIVLIFIVAIIGTASLWNSKGINVYASSDDKDNTIAVNGSASKSVMPDEGYINFTIETESDKAESAQKNNAEIWDKIKLEFNELSYLKYETQGYSVYPNQKWNKETEKYEVNGYKVNHIIKVTLSDITKSGTVVDLIVSAGVNNIDSVSFGLKKETQELIKKDLWALAYKDAKSKADLVVDATGAELNDTPKTLQLDSYNYYPPVYYAKDSAYGYAEASSIRSDISPKELDISVSLNVVFSYE